MPSKFEILRGQREQQERRYQDTQYQDTRYPDTRQAMSRFALLRQQRERAETADKTLDDSWGKFAARSGKSLMAGGLGGTADLAASAYNLPAAVANAKTATLKAQNVDPEAYAVAESMGGEIPYMPYRGEVPLIPSAAEAIEQKIDQATGQYTQTPEQEKWFQEGLKTGAALLTSGGLGALAEKAGFTGLSAFFKALGSTKPSTIAGGVAAGSTLEAATEAGMSSPEALATGVGAGVATEVGASLLNPKNITKGVMKSVGLGKNQLKREALESAEKLGVELPAAAATDSKLMGFLNQYASKMPFVGDFLREKFQTASGQYQKAFKSLLDEVGVARDDLLTQKINQLYEHSHTLIPEGDVLVPGQSLKALQEVRKKIKSTLYSEGTQKLVSKLDDMEKNLLLDQRFPLPMPVQEIINQKKELNKIIKWDKPEADVLNLLKRIQTATLEDLKAYGETNIPWYQAFQKAERKFEKVAKREDLEKMFETKITDPVTKEVKYAQIAKLLEDRKFAKRLENNLGKQGVKKLEDFAEVAQAMAVAEKNIPNPSGTAMVESVKKWIAGIGSALVGQASLPALAASGVSAYGLTQLLTSKRFLNKALQFAKEPTETLAQQIEKIVQDETGVALQVLIKEMQERREKPNEPLSKSSHTS